MHLPLCTNAWLRVAKDQRETAFPSCYSAILEQREPESLRPMACSRGVTVAEGWSYDIVVLHVGRS